MYVVLAVDFMSNYMVIAVLCVAVVKHKILICKAALTWSGFFGGFATGIESRNHSPLLKGC